MSANFLLHEVQTIWTPGNGAGKHEGRESRFLLGFTALEADGV
jgi:hypothetical protein